MSYAQLKLDTASYSHRTDLDPLFDTFVLHAEAIINKELRAGEMETVAPVSYDGALNDLPVDYAEMRGISVNNIGLKQPITMVTPDQLLEYQTADGFRNNAIAFALHGGQIEIRPAPDPATPLTGEMSYYAKVPSLTSNTTNNVLDSFPMLYLSAMLTQVYIYLQDVKELQIWEQSFNAQLAQANKTADDSRLHLPTMRIG